jgi:hypothetical protein
VAEAAKVTKKAAQAAKQAANKIVNDAKVRTATKSRKTFEVANSERTAGLGDLLHAQWKDDPKLHAKIAGAGLDVQDHLEQQRVATNKMAPAAVYRAQGWAKTDHEEDTSHAGQGTLFEHEGTVNNPTKWEDMTPRARNRTTRSLAKYGVTGASAQRNIGARLDKGHVSEDGQHANFYSAEGESVSGNKLPRSVTKEHAAANRVPFHVQAMNVAMNSPNINTVSRSSAGEMTYPNDEAATHSVKWAQSGRTGTEYEFHPDYHVPKEDKVEKTVKVRATGKKRKILAKSQDETRGYPVQGYPANARRAIDATRQVLEQGKTVAQAWLKPGPKTGPFFNAKVAPHQPEGNFSVLDIHAGEALAPHLSHDDREKVINISGVHAFNDYHQRQVMAARGLNSVSRSQSVEWRSTKLDAPGPSQAGEVAELTKKPEKPAAHEENHGQMGFSGMPVPHHVPDVVHQQVAASGPNASEMKEKNFWATNAIENARGKKRRAAAQEGMRADMNATLNAYLATGANATRPKSTEPPVRW